MEHIAEDLKIYDKCLSGEVYNVEYTKYELNKYKKINGIKIIEIWDTLENDIIGELIGNEDIDKFVKENISDKEIFKEFKNSLEYGEYWDIEHN